MPGFPMALVALEDRAAAAAAWDYAGRASSGRGLELRIVRREGTVRWIALSWQPIFAADGTWLGQRSSARDVTDSRTAREQARALSARLREVREEERTRIAREIHDVLAQDLTRIKIDLVWLRGRLERPVPPSAAERLAERVDRLCEITDAAIGSVQRIATELRPVVLDSLGLCAAVEWLGRDLEARTGIRCHVATPTDELPVCREVATAAFRVLQEALTNVIRHAHASLVEIDLAADHTGFGLVIRDNGRGIAPHVIVHPQSIGLAGMRKRVVLAGGQISFDTRPGNGTIVSLRFPFSPTPEGDER